MSANQGVLLAFNTLGGVRTPREIHRWLDTIWPGRWVDVSTVMWDLAKAGVLVRIGRGQYRI